MHELVKMGLQNLVRENRVQAAGDTTRMERNSGSVRDQPAHPKIIFTMSSIISQTSFALVFCKFTATCCRNAASSTTSFCGAPRTASWLFGVSRRADGPTSQQWSGARRPFAHPSDGGRHLNFLCFAVQWVTCAHRHTRAGSGMISESRSLPGMCFAVEGITYSKRVAQKRRSRFDRIWTMSGRGQHGKGLGKGSAKRHRKAASDNIHGITKPAIRRLARRGGVKRISNLIYDEARSALKTFLEKVVRDAVTYTDHARRKTVTAMDVVYALKRQGRTLYGFCGWMGLIMKSGSLDNA
jgi:histone H4